MGITERIFVILSQKKIPQKEFAASIGVNEKTVSAWKKNGSLPPADKISKISDCLGISVSFLLDGEEKKSSSLNLSDDEKELLFYYKKMSIENRALVRGEAKALSGALEKPLDESKNTIFIETYLLPVSAGTGIYLDNCDREMLEVEENALTHEANFALRVSGDSMEPDFKNGDVLLIRSQPTVEIGEIGIFILDGEGFVKEFGGDCLISHNKKYENIKLEQYNEIYCRGLVLGVLDDEQIV